MLIELDARMNSFPSIYVVAVAILLSRRRGLPSRNRNPTLRLHASIFKRRRVGCTYCFSYTVVLLYFLPFASVPLTVTVRVLPSGASTTCATRTTFDPFFEVTCSVWSSICLTDRMSSFGFPVDA